MRETFYFVCKVLSKKMRESLSYLFVFYFLSKFLRFHLVILEFVKIRVTKMGKNMCFFHAPRRPTRRTTSLQLPSH